MDRIYKEKVESGISICVNDIEDISVHFRGGEAYRISKNNVNDIQQYILEALGLLFMAINMKDGSVKIIHK